MRALSTRIAPLETRVFVYGEFSISIHALRQEDTNLIQFRKESKGAHRRFLTINYFLCDPNKRPEEMTAANLCGISRRALRSCIQS